MSAPVPYRLTSCVWEITLACCFSCAYCGSGGGKARENELTTAECVNVAEQLRQLGCQRVSLIGGEVFLRPDWEEIVAALTGRGIAVCVITNGYTISVLILEKLRRSGVESVAVSVDGPERVHDAFRQKGSYQRAFAAVRALCDGGIPVSVISALRSDNAPLLDEFYQTLTAYPLFAWQLQACSPMGNAASNAVDVRFDAGRVIDFVSRIAPAAPFRVFVADNIGYFTPEESSVRGTAGVCFPGCAAGLSAVGIDSVGNVRGCESMYDPRFIEGNLREQSLRQIWEREDAFSYNRKFTPDRLTGACAKCAYGQRCAGGCRSYNYFANNGNLYENPLCVHGVSLQNK